MIGNPTDGKTCKRLRIIRGLLNVSVSKAASIFCPKTGYYLAGDGGYKYEDGYIFITGRIDDVINVAGHRLSTSDIEEVVAAHDAVAECAVIGTADELKGQVPVGFVVLKGGVTIDEDNLELELVRMVRKKVGPLLVSNSR